MVVVQNIVICAEDQSNADEIKLVVSLLILLVYSNVVHDGSCRSNVKKYT